MRVRLFLKDHECKSISERSLEDLEVVYFCRIGKRIQKVVYF